MAKVTRRELLKLGAAGALGAGLNSSLLSTFASAQPKEVTMLGIWPFTGPFSDVGPVLENGMKLALEGWNYKVIGRPIKYVNRDSETKAGAATRRSEEAIDTEKAQFIIGPWSSGVALAVSEVAKRRKVLHYFSGGTEDISGARCHRYSFQWAANPYTAMKTVMDSFMKFHPNAKRWYLFVVDYAFGWSVEKYLRMAGKAHGIEFIARDYHALGEREFSGLVTKAAGAKPDVVCLINFGLDAIQGVRESYNFGLLPKIPVIMSWSAGVEELAHLKPEMRENLWVGTNFYYTVDTPVAREFAKRYRAKHGTPPGYAPGAAYGMTRILLRAMERAKSTDPQAVIKAMEGWEFEDLLGKMKIEAHNHQTLRPYFFLKCKKKAEMKDEWDFADIVATGDNPQPRELNQCKDLGSY